MEKPSATPTPETDAQTEAEAEAMLLEQLRKGDEGAYETLVRREMPRLLAVARRLVGNDADARDVVQDAFVQAYRSIDRFEGQSRLSTWLHRIAVNAALMKLRKARRKPETPIEKFLPVFESNGRPAGVWSGWGPEPSDPAERRETRRVIRASIDQLPDTYRTVLVLRDLEGMSTEEAAAALEISPGAVKTRLHRARMALRELLDPFMRGEAI